MEGARRYAGGARRPAHRLDARPAGRCSWIARALLMRISAGEVSMAPLRDCWVVPMAEDS